ncbi:MAG: S-layer homology domain-containing protein [Ruminococcaceae bacterium]|nr:S-layer homology domain-containing protein [Oscillospiraceae bacterium]
MIKRKNAIIKFVSAAIACATLITSAVIPASAAHNYREVRTYSGQFADVKQSDWYYGSVVDAYELGLVNGKTDSTFVPGGNVTIAETVKLAAVVHRLLVSGGVDESYFTARYPGGTNWYDPYLRYCMTNNIVTEEYPNYNAGASRAQVAVLLSRAVMYSEANLPEINDITQTTFKDVSNTAWYVSAIYRMYRWGIITGDGQGNINPESKVKRSEIAAIVMRVIDPAARVDVDSPKDETPKDTEDNSNTTPSAPEVSDKPTTDEQPEGTDQSIVIYEGEIDEKLFTGITTVAAEFESEDGILELGSAYAIDNISHLALEGNNISFRLYEGAGYEALGIIRGWLNDAAVGVDGTAIRSAAEVYADINERFCLWINGERLMISELWYTDHGEYTTYAFYFEEEFVPSYLDDLQFICGKVSADIALEKGLDILADRIDGSDDITPPTDEDNTSNEWDEDAYQNAIEDAKYEALSILFEHESERCTIIYGRGLYGGFNNDYRLILIFRDGSTLTVAKERLNKVRVNDSGDVLYYTVDAPDGMEIQYGINLKIQ